MSEQVSPAPINPVEAQDFAAIEQQTYKDGANHLYGVDAEGVKTPVSYEAVAAANGVEVGQPPAEAQRESDEARAAERLATNREAAAAERETALTSLSELMTNDATLDGPTLTKAGLSYEKRMKLGYGDMDTMKQDAQKLLDEKQATAEAEAAKQVRDEAAAENHAKGAAQADAWKQEKDSMTSNRLATEDRAAGIRHAAEDRIAGLSYKRKLETGGELGLKRNPELIKTIDEAARAQTIEEGLNPEEGKRYYQVPTNKAAEARAAEMGAILKASLLPGEMAEPSDGKHKAENLTYTVGPERVTASKRALGVNEVSPAAVVPEAVAALEEDPELDAELSKSVKDMDPEVRKGLLAAMNAKTAEMMAGEPNRGLNQDDTGLVTRSRGSLKRAFGRAAGMFKKAKGETVLVMSGAGTSKAGEGAESGSRTSVKDRVIIAGGVLGLAAVAFAAIRYDGGSHVSTAMDLMPKNKGGDAPQHIANALHGNGHADVVGGKVLELKDHFTFKAGDNPWDEAHKLLGPNATKEQISRVDTAMLQLNHVTPEQAQHIAIGTEWRLPMEEIAKIHAENA